MRQETESELPIDRSHSAIGGQPESSTGSPGLDPKYRPAHPAMICRLGTHDCPTNHSHQRDPPLIREIHSDVLLIGNAMDARDLRMLYDNQIAAVVDLAVNEPPAQLARDMVYCRIPIIDGDGNTDAFIETAVRSVVTLVQNRIRTLVACSEGMSRAPSIAAAAVAVLMDRNPDDCIIAIIADAPHDVSPILWSRVKSVCNQISASGNRNCGSTTKKQSGEPERE